MRKWLCFMLAAAMCIGLGQRTAVGQEADAAEKAPSPGIEPGTAPIAAVNFKDTTLAAIIDLLRETDPTFQCVVSYDAGTEPGPRIQEIKLRNTTAKSVLELLRAAYPQIEITQPDSARGWVVRVTGKPTRGGEQEERSARVEVYRLREIVDDMLRRPDAPKDRKKALEAVMSLATNVIELDGRDMTNAKMQLHEATETLAVRGVQSLHTSVMSALRSVSPTEDSQIKATQAADYQRSVFEERLRERTSERDRIARELELMSRKNVELERSLLEATKRAEPTTKAAEK